MATVNIDKVRTGLAEMRTIIAREEARLSGMQQDLGDALAAHRMGESGAQKRAATLSMNLGKLRSHLETLRSEERALLARLESMAKEEDAARVTRLQAEATALITEIEETERHFAEAIGQAFTIARRLQDLNKDHMYYRKALTFDLPEGFRPSRAPARLLNLQSLEQGDAAITRWLESSVHKPGIPAVVEKDRGVA